MVQISKEACELLLDRLQCALEGRPELKRRPMPIGLKLYMRKGGAHLGLAFPSQGDEIVTYQGRSVLIISAKDMTELSGACFLVKHQEGNPRLAVEWQQAHQVG